MGNQPVTKAKFEGITAVFTTTNDAMTAQVAKLSTQMNNNANNNVSNNTNNNKNNQNRGG